MRLQKAVVRQGGTILEKRSFTNAGPFRYSYLEALSEGDLRMFTQPLALTKLAHFVIKSQRVNNILIQKKKVCVSVLIVSKIKK